MFKKSTLSNGLRVITAPMSGTNTVTVLILCATGSDYESRELSGISHFLEHMFFKGTQRRPEARLVSQELDGMGALYNAFTTHEYTGYFVKAGKTYLEKALDILTDIYKNSLLKAEEIEREKQVIVEELHRDLDTPTQYIWWIWERLLYGDQPAGWDIIGNEKTIRALQQDDFVNYFMHQYSAPNTIVIVAGNCDETAVRELVRKNFGDARSDPPIRTKPAVVESQRVPMLHAEFKTTDQTHITLGFRGFDVTDPRHYAAGVLAIILGGGMSSRMFIRIREELGLAYNVSTAHESYSNRGYLVTYAGVDHANAIKTIQEMLSEYRKVRERPVSGEELQRVKDYIRGTTLIGLEQSNAVASFVGEQEVLLGKPLTVDEVFAKIDAVTTDDIHAVAQELMKPEKLNLAMIGPFTDTAPFQKMLFEF
ncbi:MAG: pitrilysin family protein [Patescibacteria group bacterium]